MGRPRPVGQCGMRWFSLISFNEMVNGFFPSVACAANRQAICSSFILLFCTELCLSHLPSSEPSVRTSSPWSQDSSAPNGPLRLQVMIELTLCIGWKEGSHCPQVPRPNSLTRPLANQPCLLLHHACYVTASTPPFLCPPSTPAPGTLLL